MADEDKERGLYWKYNVTRMDGADAVDGPHHGCQYFVLDITHDPFALPALRAYAIACAKTHPELARDLGNILFDAEIKRRDEQQQQQERK